MALPVSRSGRRLVVAMVNPTNMFAIDDIKFITGYEVEPHVATEASLKRAIDRAYDSAGTMADVMKGMEEDLSVVEEDDSAEAEMGLAGMDEAPIVKLVNSLIADAVRRARRTSTSNPTRSRCACAFRIDGHAARDDGAALQVQGGDPLPPQDHGRARHRRTAGAAGRTRIKIKVLNRTIDLRVSSLPTIYGEKIVMRILDKANLNIDLEKLGFEPKAMKEFCSAIANPYGMVLVTGPTGSGKTTSLYSALSRINQPEVNVSDRRGPGRVQPRRHQPGAGERGRRADLRRGAARVPAPGPQHHHGGRDPRSRHRLRSRSRRRSPGISCSPRSTPTTRRARSAA